MRLDGFLFDEPTDQMTATDLASIGGLVFGVIGTVLGVLSTWRDRAAVKVTLQWDMDVTPGGPYDHNTKWGLITVANIGRRPIYVSHVALKIPPFYPGRAYVVFQHGIEGKTLTEGAPVAVYVIPQDGLEEFARHWHLITAQVNDPSGRAWQSHPVAKRPSWAAGARD